MARGARPPAAEGPLRPSGEVSAQRGTRRGRTTGAAKAGRGRAPKRNAVAYSRLQEFKGVLDRDGALALADLKESELKG